MTTRSGMSSMTGHSSGGSHNAEMELITDSSDAMTSMLLMIAVAVGGVMVAMGLVNTIVNIAQGKHKLKDMAKPVLTTIIGGTITIASVSAIANKQSSDDDGSHSDPAPSPEPEPAPVPEIHDAPSINIDSTAAIILAVTVAVVTIVITLVVLYKRNKVKRQERKDYRNSVLRDFDYAKKRIGAISVAYMDAHVNPEYVLYKPLVISDNKMSLDFNAAFMEARQVLDECQQLIDSNKPADIDYVGKLKLRKLAMSLDRQWDDLNREAEKVGTPLLDNGQLRRAESLWSLATNESATRHERQHAMSKLQGLLAQCQADLAETPQPETADRTTKELLNAMSTIIDNGSKRGIIAAPHRFGAIANADSLPALTM